MRRATRALAWASRGIRSPARDTLLVSLALRAAYGRAAGIERAGDNAGAIAGPLLAGLLVGVLGIRQAILLSFIPGTLAAVAITVAARQARNILAAPANRSRPGFNLGELRRSGAAHALVPVAILSWGTWPQPCSSCGPRTCSRGSALGSPKRRNQRLSHWPCRTGSEAPDTVCWAWCNQLVTWAPR